MGPNLVSYLNSFSHELASKANRVRNLIGSAHWLSDGHHKEEILKSHLKKYLPSNIRATRGFVVNPISSQQSTELDILLTDVLNSVPLLSDEDLIICLPSAVIGTIEVKTTFDRATFKKALASSSNNKCIVSQGDNQHTWSAIFFYQTNDGSDVNKWIKVLEEEVQKAVESNTGISDINCLPNVIIVMSEFVAFITKSAPYEATLKLFDTKDLSAAIGLLDLYSTLNDVHFVHSTSEYDNLIDGVVDVTPVIKKIKQNGDSL
ncbi:MAG: DUF6602 domain-containing protein [Candidatus Thiodiazotropha lotti]